MEQGGRTAQQGFEAENRLASVLERFAHSVNLQESGRLSDITAQFPGLGSLGFQLRFLPDGTPAAVRRWLAKRGTHSPSPTYLVVSAPYLSERAMDECEAAGAGALDLAGNYRLAFGTYRLERIGHAPPPQARRELENLYKGKTLRVVRALLAAPHRPWQVQELARTCGVSLGTVSGVRQKLLAQGWLNLQADGAVVSDSEGLLREWADWTRPLNRVSISAYTVLSNRLVTDTLSHVREPKVVLGATSAAEWMAPFVTTKGVFLYADPDAWRKVKGFLKAEEVEKGGNLTIQFADEGLLLDRMEIKDGLWTASPAQTFVDLWRQGGRGREGAEKLLQNYLKPIWEGQKPYASWPLLEGTP